MSRILVSVLAVASVAAAGAARAEDAPAAGAKPNIILILSDDVGLGDVHCTGGPFKTPHLDRLAESGTRFEYAYAAPLCGPTRCQVLTGRYPFRTGLINNQSHDAVSPQREVMIPTVLKKAGYVTACVGKWGQICLGPKEWGFDESLSFLGSGRYWPEQLKDYTVNGERRELPEGKYLPDLMHEFIADFLARNKDRPFFLYYPMSHIHGPILRTPDSAKGADADRLYADNVEYMDKLVGRLIDELEKLKLREKTLVIFTGDNGTARFGVERSTVDGKPISGQKGTLLEGGSREPMLASWPGVTPAGRVNRDLTDFTDFLVTFADLAGAPLPDGVTLDGRSFAPQLRGEKGSPREWCYVELDGKSYARDARYKLTHDGRLFDLKNAPFEEIPVPGDTADPGAIASRKALQAVLDAHPCAKGRPEADAPGAGKGRRRNAGGQAK